MYTNMELLCSIPEINTLLSVNFTPINKTKSKIQPPPKKKHFAQAWATVSTQNMVEVVIAMIVISINIDTYVSHNSI